MNIEEARALELKEYLRQVRMHESTGASEQEGLGMQEQPAEVSEYEPRMVEQLYVAQAMCRNCMWAGEVCLYRGMPVVKSSCPNCGCANYLVPDGESRLHGRVLG